MQIGEIIREYRKRKNMTQEEMANRLGVTTPAVNKWENGVSQPDIMLLAPIARLLDITIDTLLSFEEELTIEEINNIIYEVNAKLKGEAYEEAFQLAKRKIEKFPNCEQLIWQIAMILDAWRIAKGEAKSEKYDDYINGCYVRALDSKDENIRKKAADSLFGFYLRKEEYEKAEEYLKYFSNENLEKKRKQAVIYSKTNRVNEAYKAYEELLFSGYQMMNMVFQSIYMLSMQDHNKEKAYKIVGKQSELASIFEMGAYQEASFKLDFVTAEKDIEATIKAAEKLIANVDKICDFMNSPLYEHMEFKEIDTEFITELRENILVCFRDQEVYDYMKKNKRWKTLISKQEK